MAERAVALRALGGPELNDMVRGGGPGQSAAASGDDAQLAPPATRTLAEGLTERRGLHRSTVSGDVPSLAVIS